ncbi:hypothetical protein [Enterococcus pallens]|uniref:Uncharacterized protein n=1 Tax=Enterococcus pallens ATCC BAA-351 TaxID=1158607 RepID=R2SBP3_9ENTE|nr:hypothetical protein [Enterococcus pallens]EOH90271.1 hypothetical protein UAU_04100 [Enterococcus pallens ATCC BAA-351]EOU15123.1 hypothetical protein I588_04055 [Enterococcus pallens ATCC BAA-351]OJG79146.1 hypothetical protein RV10_GL000979 [Enterococcus pallens]
MIEPILTLSSALITLITTIVGILIEKKKIENDNSPSNTQDQNFSDISTKGDNSFINITATQVQSSVVVKGHQEFKIREEEFKDNLSRLRGYNKFVWVIFPIMVLLLTYMEKIPSYEIAWLICVITINSFSISLFFRYLYHRYVKGLKDRGYEQDIISKFIRKIEYLLFPLLLFFISARSIAFSITRTPYEMSMPRTFIFVFFLYLLSFYTENLMFQFVVGKNIWKIPFFLKKLLITIVIFLSMIYLRDIFNWFVISM